MNATSPTIISAAPSKPVRRILALDGGGIRGVFSLEFLARMERLLGEQYGRHDFLLADHFDLLAGTSTGAIIAACLSWGMRVDEIRQLYGRRAREIFARAPWYKLHRGLYAADAFAGLLKSIFHEDDAAQTPALLGTAKLKTMLLLVMRNMSTGAPWPVTNNPAAMFNDPQSSESNLRIPLWQLIRASTAAPFYFPPERIRLGAVEHVFADGGVTAYNNPALIAFLTATQPCYRLNWPTGTDKLHLVSVGTGRVRVKFDPQTRALFHGLSNVAAVPGSLFDAVALQQDMLCRILGACLHGPAIDAEVGDLIPAPDDTVAGRHFSYVRYDHLFSATEIQEAEALGCGKFALDNIRLLDFMSEKGRTIAAATVRLDHLG